MFILLPSVLFCQIENSWTYLDSVYYAFINMTHIGFGDLVNMHRDQEVATKLGPWMWAYREVNQNFALFAENLFFKVLRDLKVKTRM